jgi:hypothetical protein
MSARRRFPVPTAIRPNAVVVAPTGGAVRLEAFGAGDYDFDVEFEPCRMLWVSVTGDITIVSPGDFDENGRTATNVPVGWFVCRAIKVIEATTTATIDLVGY